MPRPTAPRVDAADHDHEALELRRAGFTFREISQRMGVSVATAHKYVTRGLDRTRREPADALRDLEAERLDRLQVAATQVLERRHVVVQGGRIVKGDDGEPLQDDGPVLAAVTSLVKVQESRRKLLNLDEQAPAEAVVTIQVNLLIDLLSKALTAALPNDAVAYQFGMDAAISELRRIATDQVGPELEAGS